MPDHVFKYTKAGKPAWGVRLKFKHHAFHSHPRRALLLRKYGLLWVEGLEQRIRRAFGTYQTMIELEQGA